VSKRYYIETMGCQMNEYDSDHLARILEDSGYLRADEPDKADLVLLNTCSVRAKAEQKALSRLGRLASLKRKNRRMVLAAAGCVAQQRGEDLLDRFPGLDLVLGPRETGNFRKILKRAEEGAMRLAAVDPYRDPLFFHGGFEHFQGSVKAYITVMEGCNNFCSYCIVPYVRGM
jgi:tRNA-2-methylthio-N6-dimethylallyladenosine synthase